MFNLHIAIKAQNGSIFEQIGNTEHAKQLPSLYDHLAASLQAEVTEAETKVDPQDPEPKITLVRQVNTFYESLAHFEEALQFIEPSHEPKYA